MTSTPNSIIRKAAKKALPAIIKFRFSILLIVFSVTIFVLKTHPAKSNKTSQERRPAATTNIVEQPLFDPAKPNADPKWNAPAELNAAEMRNFVKNVAAFGEDAKSLGELTEEANRLINNQLLNDKTKDLLWPAIQGGGLKDYALAKDWYALVKDDYTFELSVAKAPAEMSLVLADAAINARLDSMKVRLIGGNIVIGDVLFVKTVQPVIHQRRIKKEELVSRLRDVVQRLKTEFPPKVE